MANLYYAEGLSPDRFAVGETLTVSGEEARHAVRVSRLRVGEHILVGNGQGSLARGEVTLIEKDRFEIAVRESSHDIEPSQRLGLVQALAKGDRDERAVEQATEFGVDLIVPWEAKRSVSRWSTAGGGDKAAKGVARWQRVAREASKQSLRHRIPEVHQAVTTEALCELAQSDESTVIALHPGADIRLSEWATSERLSRCTQVLLVVGPEGGFGDDELAELSSAGAVIASLGSLVLRTSSAGAAGLAVLNAALRRW